MSAKSDKVKKVIEEFRAGKLRSSSGDIVQSFPQALAIGISRASRLEKDD